MSTTIDQRVVEMRFDNKQFERGVSESMSTLDKLKQKLNFKGAVQGVESVNSAAKTVQSNMGGLSHSVEAVSMKFSAMQIFGVTALTNISNSAYNAGKRIISALTIDPVKTGFQEYETQINAVQTILANTSHAGTTIEDVNKALKELNDYADMTIYNFTEMTRNIGTFTAAGVNLDTSVSAIKGIANLAAVSGSTSQQASTAMYQLSQALAAGRVSLMDWNSVVNAGMGGKVFQDALTRTADVMNKGAGSKAIKKYGSFRESLTKGEWLTVDVLTETLNQFTMAAAEGSEEWEKYKASLKEKGYTDAQATEILKMANTATDAATKVKTFTQLWDVLKESAQSGWSQTWKIIIGDFEEAKNLLTPVSDVLTKLIGRMSDFRNAIIESAFGRTFSNLSDNFKTILKPAKKIGEAVGKVSMSLEELDKIATEVIRGNFGNGKERIDKLTEAGINYYRVQNKVNEKLDCSKRFSEEQIEAQDKLLGIQTKNTDETGEQADATIELTDAQKTQLIQMSKLSDAQLRQKGYTDEQIEALRELQKVAESIGIPFDKFLDQINEISGRWLFINSFKNIGNALADVGVVIKTAWKDVFPEHSIEYFANKLFNLLGTFHRVTAAMSDMLRIQVGTKLEDGVEKPIYKLTEAGENLVRIFKGIFAAFDIVTTVVGGAFKIVFKIVAELFDRFGLSVLDVLAIVGDTIVAFRDWLDEIFNVSKAVDVLVPLVKGAAKFVKNLIIAVKNSKWFKAFCDYVEEAAEGLGNLFANIPNMDGFHKLVDTLKKAGKAFSDWTKGLRDAENIPGYIISGLVKGITNGIPDVIGAVFELAKSIIDGICKVLGIHSPARAMIAIGGFIIAGLIQGILEGKVQLVTTAESIAENVWLSMKTVFSYLGERLSSLFTGIWEFISNENGHIDWGKIFAGGMIGSLTWVLYTFAKAVDGIADGIGGLGDILENTGEAIKKFGNVLTSYSWDLKARALMKLAISIGILAAAVVLIAQVDDIGKLWNAVGIIVVLAGVVAGLAVAMSLLNKSSIQLENGKLSIDGIKSGLLGIALAIGILGFVVKMIGDMDAENARRGLQALVGIAIGLVVFVGALGLITKFGGDTSGLGKTMFGMALSIGLMMLVIKMVSGMDLEDIEVGVVAIQAFMILILEMAAINRLCGTKLGKDEKFKGVTGAIMGMTVAILLMAGLAKILSGMNPEDIDIGVVAIQTFMILALEMAIINRLLGTKLGKDDKFKGVTGAIMGMTVAMLLMAIVAKIIATMNPSDIAKGAVVMQAFIVLIAEMLFISKLGKDTSKVAGTITSMAIAIGILAGVAVLLSMVDVKSLFKGIIAVGALSLLMATMTKSLKGAQNEKGAVMWLAIGVGILAAAAIALSFIPVNKLLPAVAGLSVMMLSFGAMTKMAAKMKSDWKSLLIMVGVVAALAGVVLALSMLDTGSTIEIVGSLSILMLSLGATMMIVSKAGAVGKNSLSSLAIMALIAGEITLIIGLLQKFDVAPSITTAIAVGILMLALAATFDIISAAGTVGKSGLISLGVMALIVGGMALIIGTLQKWNLAPSIETVTALTILMLGMAVVTAILSMVGATAGLAIAGAAGFAGAIVIVGGLLVAIGALMDKFPKVEEFLDKGIPILEKIGAAIGSFFGNMISGFAEGLSDCLPGIGENIRLFVEKVAETSEAASGIKPGSFDGVGDFVDAMLGISIGALVEHFTKMFTGESSVETFKTNAVEFVKAVGAISTELENVTINEDQIKVITDCGKMFTALNNSLPKTGGLLQDFLGEQDLAKFATACESFTDAMILVNTAVSAEGFVVHDDRISALVSAGERFNELNKALPKTGGFMQDFLGEQDLAKFATACESFTETMIIVNEAVSAEGFVVHDDRISALVSAGERFNELNKALPKTDGFVQDFLGEQDLGKFATACESFTETMKTVNAAVSAEDFVVNIDAIKDLCAAGTEFDKLQDVIPRSGGWWQTIAGETDIGDFGKKIEAYGKSMAAFSESVTNLNTDDIDASVGIGHSIRDLLISLNGLDLNGLVSFVGGAVNNGQLGGAMGQIAKAMAMYGDTVAGLDVEAVATSADVAHKLRGLISALAGTDPSGIENFQIQEIGAAMSDYSAKVTGLDSESVGSSVIAAHSLKSLIASLAEIDSSGIDNFKPEAIGTAMGAYSESVKGFKLSDVLKSVGVAAKLRNFITSLSGIDTSGVNSFVTAINELSSLDTSGLGKALSDVPTRLFKMGGDMVDGLAKGFTSKQDNAVESMLTILEAVCNGIKAHDVAFTLAGTKVTTSIIEGVESKSDGIKATFMIALNQAVGGVRTYYDPLYRAGMYIAGGMAKGIEEKTPSVVSKARAMANAAAQAAKEALKINSPSKVFQAIGSGVPEGFALGIEKMSNLIDKPLSGMTNAAYKSVSETVSRIATAIDSDMDVQPTIRPVLDLSDVRSGAGALSSMLDVGSSVKVLSNIGSISRSMNNRSQNGNSEVVSAINDLRKELGNVGNTSYTINGITYDDNSNIATAVRDLTRFVRLEGRV